MKNKKTINNKSFLFLILFFFSTSLISLKTLKNGELKWSAFEAGTFEEKDSFTIKQLELVELMALTSGEAPLTNESQGKCRLRLVGDGKEMDVPFSDADQA